MNLFKLAHRGRQEGSTMPTQDAAAVPEEPVVALERGFMRPFRDHPQAGTLWRTRLDGEELVLIERARRTDPHVLWFSYGPGGSLIGTISTEGLRKAGDIPIRVRRLPAVAVVKGETP